jgi:hypothetical protein
MKTQQKSRYDLPAPNPKLVKILAPLVKLDRLYQRFFDRSFRAFELAAQPFFWIAMQLEVMAKHPTKVLGTGAVIYCIYALMHQAG